MSINPSFNVASSNNASFDRPSDAMSIDTTNIDTTNKQSIKQSISQSTFPGCCVCRAVDDEILLHCRGCSINVHPACIGIPHIVDWLCCKCEYLSNDPSINQSTIECFACGQRSGYLVPTDDDRWVDIMCGTWLQGSPGPTWSSDDQGAIIQLNDAHLIDRSLFRQICTICQSNFGCCFRCSHQTISRSGKQRCDQYFHPTCAQRAGLTLQVESKDGDDDSQYLHAYCSQHSQPDQIEIHIGSIDQTESRTDEHSNAQSSSSLSSNQTSNQIRSQSLDQSNSQSINQSNNQFHHEKKYSDLSFSPSKRSSPFSSTLPVMPTSLASYRSRESSPSITQTSKQPNNRKTSKTINQTTNQAIRQGHSFPYQSPIGSPVASPSMSSATSPANHLSVNQSFSQSTDELVDHFTDKRTFHNLIEAYMRPIAAVDLLRLGQLFPPPSKRSRPITQSSTQSSSQVRKTRQKQPAHIYPVRQSINQSNNHSTSQSSTRQLQQKLESPHTSPRIDSVGPTIDLSNNQSMHQLDLSSNQSINQSTNPHGRPLSHPPRRIPFVPFERDPSLLIPYRGLTESMWSGDQSFNQSINQLPHMPSIHDLPHISALMGTDITVCNLQSMRAERVSTAPAVVVKPPGAYIIDEDAATIQPNNNQSNNPSNNPSINQSNDDAWVFRPTGQRIVYPFLPAGEVIKPVADRPLDFLHCDAKAVLERSSSPTTRIHVLLNTSDGMEFDQSIDQSINETINQAISQSKRSSFIEYRGVWNENWQDVDQPLFKDAELQGFQPVDAEGFAEELRRVRLPPVGQSVSQSFDQSPDHNPPVDPDELLRELISCQQELMQQVQSNVIRRNQISSQISWQDYIDYQTELAIHEEKTIGCYNSAVAWHTFRHSMADGMKDAVIPKHVLISQVAQAKREIKAAFIEPAAVTPYKPTISQSINQPVSQLVEQSSLSDDAPDNDIDEFVTCCVCFDNTSSEKNPMLYCDRCSLTVHRVCYGVSTLPENDWYCQYCEYQRTQAKAVKRKSNTHSNSQSINQNESASSPVAPSVVYPCALCPYRGGALKPTTDKRWCHILCALLVSGARLHDLARLEPIKGVDDALKNQARHGATCCVCRIDWGACVFCVHPGCGLAFHSYCGWLQGFYYEAELQDIDIKFITFCPHHTPDKALSEVKVAQLNILNNASTPAASPKTSPHLTSSTLYDPVLSRASVADARLDVDQLSQDPNSWIPTSAADFVVSSPFQPIPNEHIPVGTPIFARQESSMSTMSIPASSPSPSLPPPAAYPRHVLINLRLFQQRDIRNRAREDRRPKDTKKKRRRVEKRRLERSRALHEDLYPIGKCAICFMSDEQLQQQIQFNADSHNLPNRKRLNKSTWTEIISPAPASAYPHNHLLRCDQCGVEVHQSCYGVTDSALEAMKARRAAAVAEKGDDLDDELMSTGFNCMRCAAQSRDVKCELCPRKGGALKPISEGSSKVQGWAHTLCVLWFEELKFKDPVTLSGVEGINSISKMKRRMRCGLCKRGGLCLPCSEPNCEEALHPMCGMFAGVFMQMYARMDTDPKHDHSAAPSTKSSNKSMKRLLYCPRHTPVPLARFISIPHSFALMTTLRRELDVARLLLDTMRRREKIKQSLMMTEFDIQSARWEQTLQQCREARISSAAVAAAPSKTKDNVIKFKISRSSKQANSQSHSQSNSPPTDPPRTLTSIVDTTPVVSTTQVDDHVDGEQHVDSVTSHLLTQQVDQSSDMLVDLPLTPNTETERRSSRRASHQEPSPQLTPLPTPRRKRHSTDDTENKSPTPKRARHITSSQLSSAAVAPLDEAAPEPSMASAESLETSSAVDAESASVSTDATPAPRKRGPKPGSKHKSSTQSKTTPSTEPRKRGRPRSAARQAREALEASGPDDSSDGRGRKRKTSRK